MRNRPLRNRMAALGAVVVACIAVGWAFLPRQAGPWWRAVPQWGQVLQTYMAANWLTFGLGQMVVAASGLLPASLIAIMAGASFGLGRGIAISVISTMFGGWLAFLLSRSVLRKIIERHVRRHPAVARLDQGMTNEGWRFVMLLRVSPVMPFAITSYGLGLTRISQRDFLLGTAASLPALVGYVAFGAMGKQGLLLAKDGSSAWHWLPIVAGMGLMVYALWRLRQAMQKLAEA